MNIREELADYLTRLSIVLQAGAGIGDALNQPAFFQDSSLQSFHQGLTHSLAQGHPPMEAFRENLSRLPSGPAASLQTVLSAANITGAPLNIVLDTIAQTLRQEEQNERDISSAISSTMLSIVILGVLALAFPVVVMAVIGKILCMGRLLYLPLIFLTIFPMLLTAFLWTWSMAKSPALPR